MWQHQMEDKHKLMSHHHEAGPPLGRPVKHRYNMLHFTDAPVVHVCVLTQSAPASGLFNGCRRAPKSAALARYGEEAGQNPSPGRSWCRCLSSSVRPHADPLVR